MAELRYGFGKNWDEFIRRRLSDEIVHESVEHMKSFMKIDSLAGKTFLDIGCGSGIHSLAAKRLITLVQCGKLCATPASR